jgi:hypothetical protein
MPYSPSGTTRIDGRTDGRTDTIIGHDYDIALLPLNLLLLLKSVLIGVKANQE